MKIVIPEGFSCLFIGSLNTDTWQNEVLLPNDISFYIKRNFEPYKTVLMAEIVLVSEPNPLPLIESQFNETKFDKSNLTADTHNIQEFREQKSDSIEFTFQH